MTLPSGEVYDQVLAEVVVLLRAPSLPRRETRHDYGRRCCRGRRHPPWSLKQPAEEPTECTDPPLAMPRGERLDTELSLAVNAVSSARSSETSSRRRTRGMNPGISSTMLNARPRQDNVSDEMHCETARFVTVTFRCHPAHGQLLGMSYRWSTGPTGRCLSRTPPPTALGTQSDDRASPPRED